MRFKFRYLGPDGGEVEVESLDVLRALMKSGTVGELTLLYYVLTREWAPARAHAVYRLLQEEMDPAPAMSPPAPPSVGGKKQPRRRSPKRDGELPDLGLTVSFQAPAPAPDAERAIRALLREREQDGEPTQRAESFTAPPDSDPALPIVAPVMSGTPPRATPAPAAAIPARAVPLDRLQGWLNHIAERIQRLVGHRSMPPTLILAGLVGLLLLLFVAVRGGDDLASRPDAPGTEMGPAAAAVAVGPDLSRLVERFALAKASGFQNMMAGMDSLRRVHDIVDVPPVWLEGVYLADAPLYPEVEAFWHRYQAFLQDAQAGDTSLFRGGFVQEVDSEGVSDALLAMRLSRAMREFRDTQPARAAVYSEMEELARAALTLHGLLVERADDIDYDPALQAGISREPVVEAVAQDTVLHDRMWTLLERIFASLETLGGNLGGSRDNLTDMLLRGVEASSR